MYLSNSSELEVLGSRKKIGGVHGTRHQRRSSHSNGVTVQLRSSRWYGQGPFSFEHRGQTMQSGFSLEDFDAKPVVGIVTTWSEANPCHAHLREVADAVKRGVWSAGGFPLEIPVMSLGETLMKPTTMLYRNLAAIEDRGGAWSHPLDAAVLLGGCDKTTPALLMGAVSADIPSIFVPAGFMLHGNWQGTRLGAAITAWKYSEELVAGKIHWMIGTRSRTATPVHPAPAT